MPHRSRLILLASLAAIAQQRGGNAILSPAPDSVLPEGPVHVIARAEGKAGLKLDGKPVAAQEPAPGVLTAKLEAGPGVHELSLVWGGGEHKVRFAIGAASPAGWEPFRAHPPGGGCETCHAVKSGEWLLRRASLVGICFPCHDQESFPKAHTHNPGILADCQICHDPHGSAKKGHLILSRENACKQCHN